MQTKYRLLTLTILASMLLGMGVQPAMAQVSAPDVYNVSTSKSTFNPNEEFVYINWSLQNSSALVSIEIKDPTDGSTGAIRTIIPPSARVAGTYNNSWDGKDKNGNFVPAKTYEYTIYAYNPSTGLSDSFTGQVAVTYQSSCTAPIIGPTTGNDSTSYDYASPSPFDPNTQSTTIYYNLNTTTGVTMKVEIYDNSSTTGTPVATLSNPGFSSAVWNGRYSTNVVFPDGTYYYKVTATNTCGTNTETGSVQVQSSTTPTQQTPNVYNDMASPSSIDNNESTTISWSVDMPATIRVRILDDNNNVVTTLLSNYSQTSTNHSVTWDANGASDGTYTYEIRGCNPNNTSLCDTETGSIEVGNGTNTNEIDVYNDSANPSTFNPWDDEDTTIRWSVNRDARVTVTILDDNNDLVDTLLSNLSQTTTTYSVNWDGRDHNGDIVSEGTYTYKIKGCLPSNTNVCDIETGTIEVSKNGTSHNNDLIDNVTVTNDVFNPEDDERAKLCFDVLNDNTDILVQVMEGNSVVDTLVNNVSYDSGERCVYWNGEDDNNDIVNDGVYQFRIRAERDDKVQVEYAWVEVDTDGHIIGFPNDNFCGGYSDIDQNSPFCKALSLLFYRGVFTGYPDGTFRPYAPINRAETVKVMLLALDYDILSDDGTNLGFWDVIRREWYMPFLRTAKMHGIIRGYPDGSFRPGNYINRVELLKVFLESSKINIPHCTVQPYADTPITADTRWYMDYVCFAKAFNLMRTDANGNFNPGAMMTRGDVADLFYQFEMRGLFGGTNMTYYNNFYNNFNTYDYYSPYYPVYYY